MKTINIVQLYGVEMNIYGDNGNVHILNQRLQWRNIPTKVTVVGVGDRIPANTHIIVGGGGQDAGQSKIAADLMSKKGDLMAMRDSGVPMLMICGMYQMFGNYFKTGTDEIIKGIGLLDVYTEAGSNRIIGNIVSKTKFGLMVGYENHSGRTFIDGGTKSFGTTKYKQGNNGKDKSEGAVYNNVYGTYLHGPVLAKCPKFADSLLSNALELAGGKLGDALIIDDELALVAAKIAINRPR